MNSSAINSILPFNHSSAGSSLLSEATGCQKLYFLFVIQYIAAMINAFVGYPANLMVLWLVARKVIDSSTSDVFFVNLAILDAVYSLTMPMAALVITNFDQGISRYFFYTMYGMKETSPLFLTCICLDRYVAVVHPIVFTSTKDNKIRVAISMLVWPFVIAYIFMRARMKDPAAKLFTGLILTISIIMVFCNISIMWSLRKSVLGKEKISPMKKKAQRTVQSTLAIIVFHYLPTAATMLVYYFIERKTMCAVQVIAFKIMDLSSSTEPLLCISKIKQLSCLNNLPCICCRSPSPEPHNVRT